jgi:hypothetical protein
MVPKAAFWQCPETLFDIFKTLFYEGAFSKSSPQKNCKKNFNRTQSTSKQFHSQGEKCRQSLIMAPARVIH